MELLDEDPGAAVEHPEVATFVQELNQTGFVGVVRVLGPRRSLPGWLQPEFLGRHGLETPTEPLTDAELTEVDQLFDAAVQDLAYEDGPHGRYYQMAERAEPADATRQFKYYLESHELLSGLRSGQLDALLSDLQQQGLSPAQLKLFESERLVLYFAQSVDIGSQVRDAFLARGIRGRGPAQDVFEISEQAGELQIEPVNSNDGALGDGGHNPIRYEQSAYDPRTFMEHYLKLCLYAGKDPAEPYRTSFVYFSADPSSVDPALVAEAERLAAYPVLVSSSRLRTAQQL